MSITSLDYYQNRIVNIDRRFCINDYLFYALSNYEAEKVRSNINACVKKVKTLVGESLEGLHLEALEASSHDLIRT